MSQLDPVVSGQPSELREYLAILWLRKWWIAAVATVVVMAAVVLTFRQTPLYASRAKVLVESVDVSAGQTAVAIQPNIDTEKELVRSATVARLVKQRLGLPQSTDELLRHLSVDAPDATEILILTYVALSPREAQRTAQSFAEAYLSLRHDRYVQTVRASTDPLRARLGDLNDQLHRVRVSLLGKLTASRRALLQEQASLLVSQIAILDQRLNDLGATSELPVGQIEDPADLQTSPTNRRLPLNAALALFLGSAAGVGVALVRDRLDDHLRTEGDFENSSGASTLALIPRFPKEERRRRQLVATSHPTSSGADAYRVLRGAVVSAASRHQAKTLLVTSPGEGNGKTTVTANLGVALALADKRVVLVSADLRKPRLHELLGRRDDVGLTNVLANEVRPWDAIVQTATPQLFFLPSGKIDGDGQVDALSSAGMGRVLAELAEKADFILIDAPPILASSDPLALAQCADAVVLVVDARRTTRRSVAVARRQLQLVNAVLIGGVLNNFDPSKFRPYHYGAQGYGYVAVQKSTAAID